MVRGCPYTDYYINQAGGNPPVYYGRQSQQGHGLGSILGSLGRIALPFIKSIGGFLGRKALHAGVGIGSDILEGKNWKDSALTRFKSAGRDVMSEVGKRLQQQGSGRKRKRCCGKKKKKSTKRRKINTALD